MTIAAQNVTVTYVANGVTDTFSIPFTFYNNSEVVVLLRDKTTPNVIIDTELNEGGEYTIVGSNVVFGDAPDADTFVVVKRRTAQTQGLVLTNSGAVDLPSLERALDKLTMLAQEAHEKADRAVKLKNFNKTGVNPEIVEPKANGLIKFNASANAIELVDATEFTGATGPTGPQGPQGPTGSTGSQGPTGASILYGVNDPVDSNGNNGDSYVRTDTGDFFRKVSGSWEFEINLLGPQGPTGPQGATGPQGPTGATGAQGPQGLTGLKGDKGDKGDTGNTGPVGPAGPQGETGPAGNPDGVTLNNNLSGQIQIRGLESAISSSSGVFTNNTAGVNDVANLEVSIEVTGRFPIVLELVGNDSSSEVQMTKAGDTDALGALYFREGSTELARLPMGVGGASGNQILRLPVTSFKHIMVPKPTAGEKTYKVSLENVDCDEIVIRNARLIAYELAVRSA
jgi:hypothetical protein